MRKGSPAVQVRLNEEERQLLDALCVRLNLNKSAVFKKLLRLASIQKPGVPTPPVPTPSEGDVTPVVS